MSSPNYGEKNLRIKIPIEIVPEVHGIQDEIKDIQKSERGRIEEGRREGRRRIFDAEHPEEAYPQRNFPPILTGKGMMREYSPEIKAVTKLVAGIAPTQFRLGQLQPSAQGTASVPTGGRAPEGIAKKDFKKTPPNPDAGLHIYGEDGEPGTLEKIITKSLGGPARAQQALSMLKNPIALAKFLGPVAVPIFAAFLVIELTKRLTNELVRKGSVFDRTFKNVIFNRFEALRTREQQQRILVGFGETAQLITTTMAGTTNPRDAYNTYTIFNEDQAELEENFAIRNDSGYE